MLLLTRPEAQSARFAAAFRARFGCDIDILTAPVMTIAPTGAQLALDGVSGLIFTSENGVSAFAETHEARDLTAYCVGDRTANAARAAGFTAFSSRGTAEDLMADLIAAPPEGRLMHLRGAHARGNVADRLTAAGIPTREAVIYDQHAQPLPDAALDAAAAARLTLLPLFSPRSAALVGAWLAESPARLALIYMSPAVRDAWAGPAPVAAEMAAAPDAEAMLDALGKLIETGAAA
ncbi:uroporphyrinogen-III synthase [Rhodovulum iodosum]|uniref:Uroporphyrinogen-III synthase n=1 Tax=Rhodovulum iodosum TaxID=68291 RepID=A0ABV3XRI2_9RHOB|nr:uroporphyrinogen-III synthase [Rhodovulum robiginosum]